MLFASGRITNPTMAQVLVDTGPLAARDRTWQVYAAVTAGALLELQYIAEDGVTVLKSQLLAIPDFGTSNLPPMVADMISMAAGERVRIIAVTAITGQVSCSIDITT